jgi:hypothetical protein
MGRALEGLITVTILASLYTALTYKTCLVALQKLHSVELTRMTARLGDLC